MSAAAGTSTVLTKRAAPANTPAAEQRSEAGASLATNLAGQHSLAHQLQPPQCLALQVLHTQTYCDLQLLLGLGLLEEIW